MLMLVLYGRKVMRVIAVQTENQQLIVVHFTIYLYLHMVYRSYEGLLYICLWLCTTLCSVNTLLCGLSVLVHVCKCDAK